MRRVPALRMVGTPIRILLERIGGPALVARRFVPAGGLRLQYLETHLVDHCNLGCKSCGHYSPLSEPWFADPETFRRDVRRLRSLFVSVEHLRLMGGEPLLHPELSAFLNIAREALPETRIHLVTNGLLLSNMADAFWKHCAAKRIVVDMTRYPVRLDLERIRSKCAEHGVKLAIGNVTMNFFKFRHDESGGSEPARTFANCRRLFYCPFLREGRIYTCSEPALAHIPARSFGVELSVCEADSVDIHGDVTGYDVLEYLSKPIPWCRFCTTDWPSVEWGLSKRAREEWF